IAWELNAENKDTLMNSFRNLAYLLADTSKLQKDLNFIQQVQDFEVREKLLLNFIKIQLKEKSNWVLIYDNMESFSHVNHLFPHDAEQWGNGKVIITTRSEHIAKTSHIKPENIIHIDELSDEEMLILLSKILYNKEPNKLKKNEREKAVEFLRHIPPFPLDVSVAAYAIKNTNVTFEKYLTHISEYSDSYDAMQTKLVKEATNYDKTRYGIIASTVGKLGKINSNFKELFFFICLLDPKNIPQSLLEHYNNNKMVDDLIYQLRQSGLLLRESYSDVAKGNNVISIHKSTQEVGAVFFINTLSEKEKSYLIENIIRAINNFYQNCIQNKDVNAPILLLPHLDALLAAIHDMDILPENKNKYQTDLYLIKGYIHYKFTKNFVLTREYFKIVLEKDNNNFISPKPLAILLKDLANACVVMDLLDECVKYCKKSIKLCKLFEGYEAIMAENFQIMGSYYKKLNDFQKAKKFFEDALSTLSILKNKNFAEPQAEIYSQFASLYVDNYLNKKEGNIAEEYAKKALEVLGGLKIFHINNAPLPSNISCLVARYRWRYGTVLIWHDTNYDKAYENLMEAEYIMNNKCPGDMHLKGRTLGILGEVLLRKNNLEEADKTITEAINIINLSLGLNGSWTYYVVRAEIKNRQNEFKEAYEDCLQSFGTQFYIKNSFHHLRYLTSFYHGAFAKYKMKDYEKSLEHFTDFMKNMDDFCKDFLDSKIYLSLKSDNIFAITPYNPDKINEDLKGYLQNSFVIYSAIFGKQHPFVVDYIAKNIDH
ncbi:MAG: tetratricopeptide repeat protein, partial [Rickettsiales bacterium]|nr:tetratricopeptide repeat protein [Rickettsiales bacterium]